MKKKLLLTILTALLSIKNSLIAKADIVEKIVGTINEEAFTVQDLLKLSPCYGIKLEKGENSLDYALKKEDFLKKIWERLVEERILEIETKRLGIDAKKEDIDKVIDEIKKQQGIKDEEFYRKLEELGFSREGYECYIKNQINKSRIIEAIIKPRIHIDDQQLRVFYDSHSERYKAPKSLCLLQIFITSKDDKKETEKRVESVLDKIFQGEDFFILAKHFSDNPSEVDLGCLSSEEMAPGLWEDLESVRVGQPYVLETEEGVFIFLVNRKEESQLLPFEKVKQKVFDDLYMEKLEEEYRKWLNEAKARLRIREFL